MEFKKFTYKKHILVCCNVRDSERDQCSKVGGEEIYKKIKEHVAENGLSSQVWVTRTRCLGFCNPNGVNVVVYPEGKWYLELKPKEVSQFLKQELF